MRIPRFFLDENAPIPTCGEQHRLTGKEFHHLKNVLRLAPSDSVELVHATSGTAFRGQLISVDAESATIELQEQLSISNELLAHRVVLLAACTRPKVMDEVAQKSVEVGVDEICFFNAERSQHRPDANKRLARLERIIEAALKQSGADGGVPQIRIDENLATLLSDLHSKSSAGLRLIFHTGADDAPLPLVSELLLNTEGLDEALQTPDKTDENRAEMSPDEGLEILPKRAETYILIGPEGGFTQSELIEASNYGYNLVSLGPKTLRAETAAVVACAVVRLLRQRA